MLPNTPEVQQAVLGPGGVLEGGRQGLLLIDMSSIAPLASQAISARVSEKGIIMLDAPVSGGEPKAIEGTLAIMVGGPENAFAEAKPILGVMGSSVTHVGEIGSGNVAKLANQIIVALNIAAMSEAMSWLSKRASVPRRSFRPSGVDLPAARCWRPKCRWCSKAISNPASASNSTSRT